MLKVGYMYEYGDLKKYQIYNLYYAQKNRWAQNSF